MTCTGMIVLRTVYLNIEVGCVLAEEASQTVASRLVRVTQSI